MSEDPRHESSSLHADSTPRSVGFQKLTDLAIAIVWVLESCELPEEIFLSLSRGRDHISSVIDQGGYNYQGYASLPSHGGKTSHYASLNSCYDSQSTLTMKIVDSTHWAAMAARSTAKDWDSLAECHHLWRALPLDLIVSSKTLLSTAKLRRLVQYHLLYPSILILTLVLIVSNFANNFLATSVSVSISGASLEFLQPVPWLSGLSFVSGSLLLWLLAHTMNRELLRMCLKQFDSVAIMLCCFLSTALHVVNRFRFLLPTGSYSGSWIVNDFFNLVYIGGMSVVIGCIDCCMFPQRVLRVFLVVSLCHFFFVWFDNRCLNSQWEDEANCGRGDNLLGFASRELVSALNGQVTIFIFKSMLSRFRGANFGCIHPNYVPVDGLAKNSETNMSSMNSFKMAGTPSSKYSSAKLSHPASKSTSVANYGNKMFASTSSRQSLPKTSTPAVVAASRQSLPKIPSASSASSEVSALDTNPSQMVVLPKTKVEEQVATAALPRTFSL